MLEQKIKVQLWPKSLPKE